MRFKSIIALIIAIALLTVNSFAAEKYEIDKTHSVISFTVRHMSIAKVTGQFREFHGTILYDEQDITKSSVNVTIKTASVDTGNDNRDNHLRTGDFFNAPTDSLIIFASKKIEKQGESYVAIGDLTLRGVTKEVNLPFTILGKVKDHRGNTRIGVEAGLTLNRFDYGVKWDRKFDESNLIVGENVEIYLAIEASTSK
jgi:polyisoprenoid-binding protein YceI